MGAELETAVTLRDLNVRLACTFDKATLAGRVLSVNEHRLVVEMASPAALPVVGDVVTEVYLSASGMRRRRCDVLEVEQVEDGEGDSVKRLQLTAADDAARGTLWQIAHDLEAALDTLLVTQRFPGLDDGLPNIPARGHYSEEARLERLRWIEQQATCSLPALQQTRLDAARLTSNIENMIGAVEVPVGVAGPLWVRGQRAQGFYYAPYATTEGALVASASRGARGLTKAGGVFARVLSQQMIRVPLFVFSNMQGALTFSAWLRDHKETIVAETAKVSRHGKLISLTPNVIGNQVHVRFVYATGDAAGQNMTTACTWHACQWILEQLQHLSGVAVENFVIEANMSSDKKVTFASLIGGRGTRVAAECVISEAILEETFKVTKEQLLQTYGGFTAGSFRSGSVGFNINVANTIGAIFTATGQDIACVHESSLAQFHLQATAGGVHASMLLPSLIIGSVGGGTQVPAQQQMLEMMGCSGPGKSARLAEIIAGFALALDLSTLSAIAAGHFASAHERLGRNRPVQWFTAADLTPKLFTDGLRQSQGEPELEVTSVESLDVALGSSIVTELSAMRAQNKLLGLIPLRLGLRRSADAGVESLEVITKVKPIDDEVIMMVDSMASMCSPRLARAHRQFRNDTGFAGCHERELGVLAQSDERLHAHVPKLYQSIRDPDREAYVLVMEYLRDMALLDTADDPSAWDERAIHAAIDGISAIHSIWLGREDELQREPWLGTPPSATRMVEMQPLWRALIEHAGTEFPRWVLPDDVDRWIEMIADIGVWWRELEEMPRTLIHHDFNPRNVGLRRDGDGVKLVAYDWELATSHVPQRDLAELLAFVLPADVDRATVLGYVERHRARLEKESDSVIEPQLWQRGFELALRDFAVNRVGLYLMAHTFRDYGFMRRVFDVTKHLLEMFSAGQRMGH